MDILDKVSKNSRSLPFSSPRKRHVEQTETQFRTVSTDSTQHRVTHIDTTYLGNGFLISHYCLFDQTVHFDIPIAARNDHPGPSKTHGDFHSS